MTALAIAFCLGFGACAALVWWWARGWFADPDAIERGLDATETLDPIHELSRRTP